MKNITKKIYLSMLIITTMIFNTYNVYASTGEKIKILGESLIFIVPFLCLILSIFLCNKYIENKKNQNEVLKETVSIKKKIKKLMIYTYLLIILILYFSNKFENLGISLIFPAAGLYCVYCVITGKIYIFKQGINAIIDKTFIILMSIFFMIVPWFKFFFPITSQNIIYLIGYLLGMLCVIGMSICANKIPNSTEIYSSENIKNSNNMDYEQIEKKRKKIKRITYLVLIGINLPILCVTLLVWGVFIYQYASQNIKAQNYLETTATLVSYNSEGATYEYIVDGVTYEGSPNLISNEYDETIKVKYNQDNPKEYVMDEQLPKLITIATICLCIVIFHITMIVFIAKIILNKILG